MKTKEQLKAEMAALTRQLETVEVQEEILQRLDVCKRSKRDDKKHDWHLQDFEERIELAEYLTWDRPGSGFKTPMGATQTAKLVCMACAARLAYEQDR